MKRHLCNFLHILLIFIVSLPVTLLTFVVVPLALIGLTPEDKHLPRWARWWETYDNDINGDGPWAGPEHANGQQNTYWWRLRWLIRNKTGVFSYEVTGMDRAEVFDYSTQGDVLTGNRPGHSGNLYAEAYMNDGRRIFPCYYFVRQWGNSNRCIRIYAGWKFRQSKRVSLWPTTGLAQFVLSINPFQFFETRP